MALALPRTGAAASITPAVAGLFVGEEKIVEGPVTVAEREDGAVHLQLGTPPKGLRVSLIIGLLSKFPPDPERYYAGKTVRVAGTIRSFRGRLEMVIHDPANIQVAGTRGATPNEAALQQKVETLTERVHELESQVHRLQHDAGGEP